MEQWGKLLVYYKTKAVLGFLGESHLFLASALARVVFRDKCETDPESRGSAGVGGKNGLSDESRGDGPVGGLRICETNPEARGGAGGGDESA